MTIQKLNSKDKRYVYFYECILKDFDLSIAEGYLLLLIYSLSRTDDGCYASKKYLADRLNVSETTIFHLINNLVKKGLLIKIGFSGFRTSRYDPSFEVEEYIKKLKDVDINSIT